MSTYPKIPDPETYQRLLTNLRQTRLEIEEFNLELAEINALLAEQLRNQRLNRVQNYLKQMKHQS
ncbi:hypothetical protein C7H19_13210 [Aphanothece hegewaldii CCALA 016]|uniref:Uncharacterized protein n=1 Tax=Aphanothece hegewaldii CCALA 016 TaxID=2107694 RepID=A0A2T1LX06_9CHRO|nr:hypothetical protein [Aphanothece hegewaldii]PSF36681.1 hypothetical protein C7H19_13210 [Aphanothece hegewaldii CCALA 016]